MSTLKHIRWVGCIHNKDGGERLSIRRLGYPWLFIMSTNNNKSQKVVVTVRRDTVRQTGHQVKMYIILKLIIYSNVQEVKIISIFQKEEEIQMINCNH